MTPRAARGSPWKAYFPDILTGLYALAVLVCIPLAFDFDGAIDPSWTLALIGLTLPWSLVSVLFAWALIHGAGLGFFTVMYLVFGLVNSMILYHVCAALRRRPAGGRE